MSAVAPTWLAPFGEQLHRRPAIFVSIAAVLFAALCGMVLVLAIGVSLPEAVAAFAEGAWGSPYAVAASINRALALGLVGIGFVLAQRANLTNVGGEGQIALGGIAATAVALYGGASHLALPWSFSRPRSAPTRSSARCCSRSSPSGCSTAASSPTRCCASR
jgi:simple sugar transport system permease protein